MFCDKNGDGKVSASSTQENSEITQENHFYPFGLNMEGTWQNTPSVLDNKYQYNGKEWNDDFGLNLNDYEARMYDPAIGRWNALDPMAEMYGFYSPYHYVLNNPMRFIDPNGMESEDIIEKRKNTQTGTIKGHANESGNNWSGVMIFQQGQDTKSKGDSPNPPSWNNNALNKALGVSALTLADDVTGIGVADDVLIPFIIVIGGIKVSMDNKEFLSYYMKSLARTASRNYAANFGVQYSLRATVAGNYPVYSYGSPVPTSQKYLQTGEVWKYGETTNVDDRYLVSYLNSIGKGVVLFPEFIGTVVQIKMMEKMKIFTYLVKNHELPPGNKVRK